MKYNKISSVPYTHMTSVSYPTCNKRKQAIAEPGSKNLQKNHPAKPRHAQKYLGL